MTEHYYTQTPTGEHNEKSWRFELLGHDLEFTTDSGVFSKNTVDYGTRAMLEAFDTELPAGKILDLGAGYGPVAISLAKTLPDREFVAAEINERAAALIEKNAKTNKVAERITVVQSDVYSNVEGTFAAILVNPPVRAGKEIVKQMISEAIDHLEPMGTLTVVLQKKQGAPSAKALMEETFGNAKTISKDKGYYIIESVKNV